MIIMAGISDLPMLHDIDADYSPQYVKLARILRGKVESGEYHQGDIIPVVTSPSSIGGLSGLPPTPSRCSQRTSTSATCESSHPIA